MEVLDWTPGMPGKGAVMDDGSVITWNYSGDIDDAIHGEVLEDMGLDVRDTILTFYLDPDGTVRVLEGEAAPEAKQVLESHGFNVSEIPTDDYEGWTAGIHVASVLNWEEGQYGRGIVADGVVHTFDSDEYYNHAEYEDQHRLRADVRFGIQPDGEVLNADVGPIPPWAIEAIEEVDPRLHVTDDTELRWMG